MPQILKPEIFDYKDLDLYDLKDLKKKSKKLYSDKHITVRWKRGNKKSIADEEHIFLIYKKQIVSVVEFWFMKIDGVEVPKIKNSTTLKEYRGRGFGTLLYNCLINHFGCLVSDLTLNGNKTKPNGSYGLWLKLIKQYKHFILDEREEEILKYTKYIAFESPKRAYRRLIITKNIKFKIKKVEIES